MYIMTHIRLIRDLAPKCTSSRLQLTGTEEEMWMYLRSEEPELVWAEAIQKRCHQAVMNALNVSHERLIEENWSEEQAAEIP